MSLRKASIRRVGRPFGAPKLQPVAIGWPAAAARITVKTFHLTRPAMKKIAPYIIVFLFALLVWDVYSDFGGMHFDIDREEYDGPLAALLGLLLASGGVLLGVLVMAVVGVVLALLFAGVGIIVVGALAVAAVAVAAAVSPLLLPLLLPIAVIYYLASRNRPKHAA
jgi:hypothetical protein